MVETGFMFCLVFVILSQVWEFRKSNSISDDKVTECHSDLDIIHLGCDEVWSLGQSLATQEYMEKMSVTVTDIFLDHVTSVANIAKTLVPGVKV